MWNYSTTQWFHSLSMCMITGGRGCMRGESALLFMWPGRLPRRDEAQAVTITHTEQLQINSLQQQPLSSPAATRSASARNQPANSFRSELCGGGEGRRFHCVIVMLCNWQVCLNPACDTNMAPPAPCWGRTTNTSAPRNVNIHARMTGLFTDDGLFIRLNIHCVQQIIDSIMCEPETIRVVQALSGQLDWYWYWLN